MTKIIFSTAVLATTLLFAVARAQVVDTEQIYLDTSGKEIRTRPIDPNERTLVVIHAGEANRVNIVPTLYVPPHSSRIDNLNIYDGSLYEINGPMLGTSYYVPPSNPGNISARMDELFIADNIADRVISVTIAVGVSSITDWALGRFNTRFRTTMQRLTALGVVPGSNLKMIVDWAQGPTDNTFETSSGVWEQRFRQMVAGAKAAGFSGRWFVATDTWFVGKTSAFLQQAQAAVCNNMDIFPGFNSDSLDQSFRNDPAGHFSDEGAALVASGTLITIQNSGPLF
jgi:hypothetical protein